LHETSEFLYRFFSFFAQVASWLIQSDLVIPAVRDPEVSPIYPAIADAHQIPDRVASQLEPLLSTHYG